MDFEQLQEKYKLLGLELGRVTGLLRSSEKTAEQMHETVENLEKTHDQQIKIIAENADTVSITDDPGIISLSLSLQRLKPLSIQ